MNKWRQRIGYGVGDLGCNLVFATMGSYLMFFYTDVFGITVAAAGTLMLVTRLIDAFTDPAMGYLLDRTNTRWGQGRPYFLIGAIPFAVLTILTFIVPDFSMTGKLIWAYITYNLLSLAYTVVNMPLNSIVPRLSAERKERNYLVSSRMIFALLGTAVVMTVTMPLVNFFGQGDSERGFLITMGLYGIIAMILFFVTFFNTRETVPPTVKPGNSSFKDDLTGLTGQTIIFFILSILYFALFNIRNTTVIYYFTYNIDKPEWLAFVGLFGILSGLPMLLVIPWFQNIMTNKSILIMNAIIYIIGNFVLYFSDPSQLVMLIVGLGITGLGIYGIFGTIYAIQPDIIDYSEYKKNRSIAGMIAALQSFAAKASMGIAGWFIGFLLSVGGYVPNVAQDSTALKYIEISFIWTPIVICVLVIVTTLFYKLDTLRPEVNEELNRRRLSKLGDEYKG